MLFLNSKLSNFRKIFNLISSLKIEGMLDNLFLMLFSNCVTTKISTDIASVRTKNDLITRFGNPHNINYQEGGVQIWEYYNQRGDLYARYWIDKSGSIYYRSSYGVPDKTLTVVGWVIFIVGCFGAGLLLGS